MNIEKLGAYNPSEFTIIAHDDGPIDLSCTIISKQADDYSRQQIELHSQMQVAFDKMKSSNQAYKLKLQALTSENEKLKNIVSQMEINESETSSIYIKKLENLEIENSSLQQQINYTKNPATSPAELKEILQRISATFKEMKKDFADNIPKLFELLNSKDKNEYRSSFKKLLKTETTTIKNIAAEVEMLFTAHASKPKDEATIELHKSMFTLWNDVNLDAYQLGVSRNFLIKKITALELESKIKATQELYVKKLEELSQPKDTIPGILPYAFGYYIDSGKLGAFQTHLEAKQNEFDEINKFAFSHEKKLTEFHKLFKPLEDHSENLKKLAGCDILQAKANEELSNKIRMNFDTDFRELYARSIKSWAELCKAQEAVHEEIAVLEGGLASTKWVFPSYGEQKEERKLKYAPVGVY